MTPWTEKSAEWSCTRCGVSLPSQRCPLCDAPPKPRRPTRNEVQAWLETRCGSGSLEERIGVALLASLDVVEAADSAAPWDDDALLDALRRWREG